MKLTAYEHKMELRAWGIIKNSSIPLVAMKWFTMKQTGTHVLVAAIPASTSDNDVTGQQDQDIEPGIQGDPVALDIPDDLVDHEEGDDPDDDPQAHGENVGGPGTAGGQPVAEQEQEGEGGRGQDHGICRGSCPCCSLYHCGEVHTWDSLTYQTKRH